MGDLKEPRLEAYEALSRRPSLEGSPGSWIGIEPIDRKTWCKVTEDGLVVLDQPPFGLLTDELREVLSDEDWLTEDYVLVKWKHCVVDVLPDGHLALSFGEQVLAQSDLFILDIERIHELDPAMAGGILRAVRMVFAERAVRDGEAMRSDIRSFFARLNATFGSRFDGDRPRGRPRKYLN